MNELNALGNRVTKYAGLETFPKPPLCDKVALISDEMTAVCPVTQQPDWYTVRVEYRPTTKCIESKTFKLFIQSFRESGHFCEALATKILEEVVKSVDPLECVVLLVQKARGGVSIESVSSYLKG